MFSTVALLVACMSFLFCPCYICYSDATPEEIAKIHQERAAMRKSQAEMHSLRMDMLYKLSIANHVSMVRTLQQLNSKLRKYDS